MYKLHRRTDIFCVKLNKQIVKMDEKSDIVEEAINPVKIRSKPKRNPVSRSAYL